MIDRTQAFIRFLEGRQYSKTEIRRAEKTGEPCIVYNRLPNLVRQLMVRERLDYQAAISKLKPYMRRLIVAQRKLNRAKNLEVMANNMFSTVEADLKGQP